MTRMNQNQTSNNEKLDLLIIGGSAAATAAGIYAARRELNFKIVSYDFGGEVANSGKIGNYPGFNETDGISLANIFRQQLEFNKVATELGVKVESIVKKSEGDFIIAGKKDSVRIEYHAKAVLITTGVHPRELNAEGEKELRNKGVSYCTTCDGPLYRNKIVAIIGGGNSALESALLLKEICPKVYLLTINDELIGETIYITKLKQAKNVEIIFGAETKSFIGSDPSTGSGQVRLEAVEYLDKKSGAKKKIAVQGVFVHIGLVPNSDFLPKEIEKNKLGEVVVNKLGETSISGMYAAGDVTDIPFKQIAIASGQGVVAVLRAIQYIDRL